MYRWSTVILCMYVYTVILEAIYTPHFFNTIKIFMVTTQKEVLRSWWGQRNLNPLNEWHFLCFLFRKFICWPLLILYSSHNFTNIYKLLKALICFILVHYNFIMQNCMVFFLLPISKSVMLTFCNLIDHEVDFLRPLALHFCWHKSK